MKKILFIIFILIIIIWGGYSIRLGYVMSPDSYTYSNWADNLISCNFNIFAYLESVQFFVPSYLYLGFVALVSAAKIVGGSFWPWLIVAINVILGASLGVMLADTVFLITKNKISALFAVLLYIFNIEIFLWARYILSDISYMFINFFVFYLLIKFLTDGAFFKFKYLLLIFIALLMSCFYRPVGFLMAPIVILFCYLIFKKDIRLKKQFWYALFCFIFIAMVIHSLTLKYIVALQSQPGGMPLSDFIVNLYKQGVVIHDRSHTFHNIPITVLDYFKITIDKFVSFFYFSDHMFSFIHKFLNYILFVPLYVFAMLGITSIFKEKTGSVKNFAVSFSIVVILVYAAYHAMTIIDFDWRYRLVILPYMIILAGIGFAFLMSQLKKEK